MPELLTIDEAAEYLRLKPGSLYTQRHRGDLRGALAFKVGRKLLFRRSSLENYLAKQESVALAGRSGAGSGWEPAVTLSLLHHPRAEVETVGAAVTNGNEGVSVILDILPQPLVCSAPALLPQLMPGLVRAVEHMLDPPMLVVHRVSVVQFLGGALAALGSAQLRSRPQRLGVDAPKVSAERRCYQRFGLR